MAMTNRTNLLALSALACLVAGSASAGGLGRRSAAAPQENSGAPGTTQAAPAKSSPADAPAQILVPAGTRLPLVLHNSVTTRTAQPGDPLYFETTFPVVINDRIVIPAGSYAQGEITEAKRASKGKGNAEIRMRLTTLVLPNGYTVKFSAVPTNADTGGTEYADKDKNKEGQINNDRDKAADAGTVIKTTGAGAGIGAIAAGGARGAGIGAAAGAAVGLATVLSQRGPEVELPRGSSVDILIDRPFYLDASKINFTEPGRASQIPGPSGRQPSRSIPF